MKVFVERIVIPNMRLRSKCTFIVGVDEEMFEDDPIEFVKRDLEGHGK